MLSLNPAQQEAIQHTNGPMLVLAGAGSGKTTVLVNRIQLLIETHDVLPSSLLLVTFTTKAANEMKERVVKALGEEVANEIWIMTFHSMCTKILKSCSRKDFDYINRSFSSSFSIFQPEQSRKIMNEAIISCGYNPQQITANGMCYFISLLKNELIDIKSLKKFSPRFKWIDWEKSKTLIKNKIPSEKLTIVVNVYAKYQKLMEKENAMDFDDLIMYTLWMFRFHPTLLSYYQNKFHYLMIDEYQDTNHAQYILSKLIARKNRNISVVGDDYQSIYTFRGSDVRNILRFDKDYPEAKLIKLEENYRCPPIVLQAANELISKNYNQKSKTLFTSKTNNEKIGHYIAIDEEDEARFVINRIRQLVKQGYSYKDFSVLFRTNQQSSIFENALMRSSIPYQLVGKTLFFDEPIIEYIMNFLNTVTNKNVNDITHCFSLFCNAKPQITKRDIHMVLSRKTCLSNQHNHKRLIHFIKLINYWHKHLVINKEPRLMEFISKIILKAKCFHGFFNTNDKTAKRHSLQIVNEFFELGVLFLKNNYCSSLNSFLDFLNETKASLQEYNSHSVQLMTLHAAKGLEFPIVFLVGMEEGVFPHFKSSDGHSLEEERRLAYVGITRAKHKLFMTRSKERTVWGREEENQPSRFLKEFNSDYFENYV